MGHSSTITVSGEKFRLSHVFGGREFSGTYRRFGAGDLERRPQTYGRRLDEPKVGSGAVVEPGEGLVADGLAGREIDDRLEHRVVRLSVED